MRKFAHLFRTHSGVPTYPPLSSWPLDWLMKPLVAVKAIGTRWLDLGVARSMRWELQQHGSWHPSPSLSQR
jgi:hypothetical protein